MTSDTTLRSIGPSVFAPTLLYSIGQGAIAPVVALSAMELGASVAVAGLVVGLAGLGQLVGAVPAGWLTGRVGERPAMLGAAGLACAALLVCVLATRVWMLGAAIAATGLAAAVWGLARQAYVTDATPPHLRARALSTLGGCARIGMFLGPFLGAGLMLVLGTDGAYWTHLLAAGVAVLLLLGLPDVTAGAARPPTASTATVVREHLPVLRTLGVGVLLIGAVRASRQVVIPLWADHLGLDPATTSVVFGLSGAVDMLLFYPAGYVMDRYGRAWAAVPSMLVLAVAHLLLPLAGTTGALTAVALVMGVGNGLGSGIIMTLGSDASPPVGRAAFLGVWRLCADAGTGLGPAVLVMGGVGVLAAAVMGRWAPRRA